MRDTALGARVCDPQQLPYFNTPTFKPIGEIGVTLPWPSALSKDRFNGSTVQRFTLRLCAFAPLR
jgi:hypothetical protein